MIFRKLNFSCILISGLFLSSLYPKNVSAQFYKNIIGNKSEGNTVKGLTEAQLTDISNKLKSDINYLSSEKLSVRGTGTGGERMTGIFLQSRMEQELLLPYQGNFRHSFKFISGKSITPEARLKIDNKFVFIPEDAFPATFSATAELEDFILPETTEPYTTWLVPLYQSVQEANNPTFDWEKDVYERSKNAIKRNAIAIIFYDPYGAKNPPSFSKVAKYETLSIPVIILQKKAYEQHIQSMNSIKPYFANIKFKNDYSEGNNVIGYINNNAIKTVVISASYDRSGRDNNMGKGNTDMQELSNDASGVAAMLSLSKVLKASSFIQYNYVFIASSGSEQGFLGTQSFLKELGADTSKIAYAINLDKVASLSSSRKLYVSGGNTSVLFRNVFKSVDSSFKMSRENLNKVNADQDNFNEKGIPALYFSTANPEHKMSNLGANYPGLKDVVSYIYNFIGELNFKQTPVFNTSIEVQNANASTSTTPNKLAKPTVDLGIKLDYEYDKIGVLVKSVDPNSPAQKAGILPEDIVFQIGTFRVDNESSLKDVLTKFKKRDKTQIKIKRGVTVQTFNLMF